MDNRDISGEFSNVVFQFEPCKWFTSTVLLKLNLNYLHDWIPRGAIEKICYFYALGELTLKVVCVESSFYKLVLLYTSVPANALPYQLSWCSGECSPSVNCRPCAEHWCTASITALPPSEESTLLFMTLTHAVMGISLLHLYWACVETGNTDKYGAYPQHQ